MRPFLRLGGPVKDPNNDHSFMTFLTVDALLPQNLAVSLIAYNEEKSYYAMKNIMNCRIAQYNEEDDSFIFGKTSKYQQVMK